MLPHSQLGLLNIFKARQMFRLMYLQQASIEQGPRLLVVEAVHAADLHALPPECRDLGVVGKVWAGEAAPAATPKQDVSALAARLAMAGHKAFARLGQAPAPPGRRQADRTQLDRQFPVRGLLMVPNRLFAAGRGDGWARSCVGLQPERDLKLVVLDEALEFVDIPYGREVTLHRDQNLPKILKLFINFLSAIPTL